MTTTTLHPWAGRLSALVVACILAFGALFQSQDDLGRKRSFLANDTKNTVVHHIRSLVLGGSHGSGVLGRPVAVKVSLESLCKDSKAFVLDQLVPTYQALGPELMDLTVVAFGNARFLNTSTTTTTLTAHPHDAPPPQHGVVGCQHGPGECQANSYMQCAAEIYDKDPVGKAPRRSFPFVACLFETLPLGGYVLLDTAAFAHCAQVASLDFVALQTCHNDPETSYRLQWEAALVTPPEHNHVPWVQINGAHVSEQGDDFSLRQTVCDAYVRTNGETTRPAACVLDDETKEEDKEEEEQAATSDANVPTTTTPDVTTGTQDLNAMTKEQLMVLVEHMETKSDQASVAYRELKRQLDQTQDQLFTCRKQALWDELHLSSKTQTLLEQEQQAHANTKLKLSKRKAKAKTAAAAAKDSNNNNNTKLEQDLHATQQSLAKVQAKLEKINQEKHEMKMKQVANQEKKLETQHLKLQLQLALAQQEEQKEEKDHEDTAAETKKKYTSNSQAKPQPKTKDQVEDTTKDSNSNPSSAEPNKKKKASNVEKDSVKGNSSAQRKTKDKSNKRQELDRR